MNKLTSQGEGVIDDLARRHGFSRDAVLHMLSAVRNGNGRMAMFSHPEFGGPGQWMHGGMLMLSAPFDHALKARVDALCHEIADCLADPSWSLWEGNSSARTRGAPGCAQGGGPAAQTGRFTSDHVGPWWPAELGAPDASGTQDGVRYAWFADARRLAVETHGTLRVYDTQDHQITGISQQQGEASSLTFTSQHGRVELASLPLVSSDAVADAKARGGGDPAPAGAESGEADILATLERLDALRQRGVITEEEFAAKKTDLLGRL